jgi:hypothetical protein
MGNQGLNHYAQNKDYPLFSTAYRTKGRVVVYGARREEPTWGRLHPRHKGLRRVVEIIADTHGGLIG